MENKMIDLMTPRYEVVADYPESKFKIGQTVTLKEIHPYSGYSFIMGDFVLSPEWFVKYPHLFRPLAWHEKRDIKDMPQYVKKSFSKEVIKIDEISNLELMISKGFVMDENTADITAFGSAFFNHYIPATEQEYEDFVNSKKQPK